MILQGVNGLVGTKRELSGEDYLKSKGDLAELKFYLKAHELGFVAAKPFGDNAHYDFIVDFNGRLSRVQVRSCHTPVQHKDGSISYHISATHSCKMRKAIYSAKDTDFLVALLLPDEKWFVIPAKDIDKSTIHINLSNGSSQWIKYLDAWNLMSRIPRATPKPYFRKDRGAWVIRVRVDEPNGIKDKWISNHNGCPFLTKESAEEAILEIWPNL